MPNRKFLRSTNTCNVYIQHRPINIVVARQTYKCIHCLADLKIQNSGLRCSLNQNHYGFIHRDEAKVLTDEERYMKLGDMFPSDYIRGIDVHEPTKVKILSVKKEQARNRDTNQIEPAYIVYFEGMNKGVRLNLTIGKEIAKILNDDELDSDNWVGGYVTLYRTKIKSFGVEHIVVRVRKPERGDKPPGSAKGEKPLNTLSKAEFTNKANKELNLSPALVGFVLKQAGLINGQGYEAEKAPQMWDKLTSIGVKLADFVQVILTEIPYYADEKSVLHYFQENQLTYEPLESIEQRLYHLLDEHAKAAADLSVVEDN